MSETHPCAMNRVDLCDRQVGLAMLMCRNHWFQVPKSVRDRIWDTWGGGAGVLNPEYREAVREAIDAVRARR